MIFRACQCGPLLSPVLLSDYKMNTLGQRMGQLRFCVTQENNFNLEDAFRWNDRRKDGKKGGHTNTKQHDMRDSLPHTNKAKAVYALNFDELISYSASTHRHSYYPYTLTPPVNTSRVLTLIVVVAGILFIIVLVLGMPSLLWHFSAATGLL